MRRIIIGMAALAAILSSISTAAQEVAAESKDRVVEKAKLEAAEKTQSDERKTALVATLILKVINPSDARVALREKATELVGHPILLTDHSVEVKVPPARLSAFIAAAGEQGIVVEKTLAREDLTLEIAQLEGTLKSKREILGRLRGFFDDSNLSATLRIEQTMTNLVAEIEAIKGRLRVLRDRTKWALVNISFRFKRRDRIVYVSSPFEWLNTVNLDRFLEEF